MTDHLPPGAGLAVGAIVYPLAWSAVLIASSGDWCSADASLAVLRWLLSWFFLPDPVAWASVNFWLRKSVHFLAYGCLYFLWFRAIPPYGRRHPWRATGLALGLCLVVALLDEGIQRWSSSRTPSWGDLLLDLSGAGAAAGLAAGLYRPREPEPRPEASQTRLV